MPKIIRLESENFKRLRAVRIEPNGSVVVLNGANGSGKSSVLDSIWAALGGKDASPEEPIRTGARKALARVTLDSGIVAERTWTRTGSTLRLTGSEGQELRKPQAVLDALCSRHTVDPLAFAGLKPADQAATLKRIAGLDFTDLEGKRQRLYDERTGVNRDVKRLQAELDGMPEHDPTAPAEEVSAQELTDKMRAALTAKSDHERRQNTLVETVAANVKLSQRIETLRLEMVKLQDSLDQRVAWVEQESAAIEEAEAAIVDPETFGAQLDVLNETNAKVRANKALAEKNSELMGAEDRAAELTEQIGDIDQKKAGRLAAAHFPIDGLGFDDCGITYRGLPFSQASHAERVRVSAAIGLALHPELRVLLVRDAEKLDEDGMRLMAELADQHDAQLWLERAGHQDPGAVVIEDGAVSGAL
jgi:DNA repair exonuclease SbcCD ATPase subunit